MKDGPEKFMSRWYMIEIRKSAYGHYLSPLNSETCGGEHHILSFYPQGTEECQEGLRSEEIEMFMKLEERIHQR